MYSQDRRGSFQCPFAGLTDMSRGAMDLSRRISSAHFSDSLPSSWTPAFAPNRQHFCLFVGGLPQATEMYLSTGKDGKCLGIYIPH